MQRKEYSIVVKFIIVLIGLMPIKVNSQGTIIQSEEDYYTINSVNIPDEIKLEVGGIAVLEDGRVAVATRRGEIWIIQNAYGDGASPKYTRFASGLHEVLGLAYKDGSFICAQRGELTKITDEDGDGRADKFEPIYVFDLSGNYHEYAYGPVLDQIGNMYVTLNVAWIGYGAGLAKWHGWLLKIHPDGSMEPVATGLRSPAGLVVNSSNDLLYSENQGDWVGSGRITHLEKGDFAGNAGGLAWTGDSSSPLQLTRSDLNAVDGKGTMYDAAKKIKQLKLPAVWFPHTLMGISTADILEDQTGGGFGVYNGHYFVADQGHSKLMRMTLEKINGKYQGACYPFREGFSSGTLRLRWGVDNSMFVGMTSRGWASSGTELFGLQRLTWTGKVPFEMKEIKAMPDGFQIEFTLPVESKSLTNANSYALSSFTYSYHQHYGSPVILKSERVLKGIVPSSDGRKVRLVLDSLKPGYINEIKLSGLKSVDGIPLLHDVGYYTLNNIPVGDKLKLTPAQKVNAHKHQKMAKSGKPQSVPNSSIKRRIKMPSSWKAPDQILILNTRPGLRYDKNFLQVKSKSKIKLVFNNNDDMTHNVVITMPGSADEVGNMAINMGLQGPQQNFVPTSPKVLFHTALLQPNSSESIFFTAPELPGDYQFVCTYPGHASVMRGIFRVVN